MIQESIEQVKMALYDAKNYAEKYIDYKANGNEKYAQNFYEMAQDEIKHSKYLFEVLQDEVEKIERVYRPTETMEKEWHEAQKYYKDEKELIEQILLA